MRAQRHGGFILQPARHVYGIRGLKRAVFPAQVGFGVHRGEMTILGWAGILATHASGSAQSASLEDIIA